MIEIFNFLRFLLFLRYWILIYDFKRNSILALSQFTEYFIIIIASNKKMVCKLLNNMSDYQLGE